MTGRIRHKADSGHSSTARPESGIYDLPTTTSQQLFEGALGDAALGRFSLHSQSSRQILCFL